MGLIKQPETELQYWWAIEELGGFISHMNRGLAHGRIPSGQGVEEDILNAREISTELVNELFENFGVVHPSDCPKSKFGEETPKAPFGIKWYWDWYNEMKIESYRDEYNNMICSACPFSEGVEWYMSNQSVPCKNLKQSCRSLPRHDLCVMVMWEGWDEKKLSEQIIEASDADTLEKFHAKREEIKKLLAEAEAN